MKLIVPNGMSEIFARDVVRVTDLLFYHKGELKLHHIENALLSVMGYEKDKLIPEHIELVLEANGFVIDIPE